MTPTKQDDALAALDWLENLLQGCVDTEGEHNEKCRIVRQALTSGAGGVWRPISEAQRDKGYLIGINMRGCAPHPIFIMKSTFEPSDEFKTCSESACWKERYADWPCYPTHWMPLPAAPGERG